MRPISLVFVVLSSIVSSEAGDWPQWRGPSQNGISTETGWKSEWSSGSGPRTAWKAEVGIGFSSFAIAKGRVYTAGFAKDRDSVFCFDEKTGKLIWQHRYAAELGPKYYEGGTSATPTVEAGTVYFLSRWGDAMGLDAETGKPMWETNVKTETGATVPEWGFGGSALVQGNLVFFSVGDAGLALEKGTGKIRWKSGEEAAGYATPVATDMGKTIVFSSAKTYTAVEAATGKQVWQHAWKTRYGVNAADPIFAPGQVFISSGYEKGAALLNVAGSKTERVWESKAMRSQFNSCVLVDGHLYGPDGNDGKASLRCIEMKSGTSMWEVKGFGCGGLMVADGKLIALSEKGELMIGPVSPVAFTPTASVPVLNGRCWAMPVLANGRIYCRNAAGSVVCLDVQ
jgi:outer membrane protein assembly factor BamB